MKSAKNRFGTMRFLVIGLILSLSAIFIAVGCSNSVSQPSTPSPSPPQSPAQTMACQAGTPIDTTGMSYRVVNNSNTEAIFTVDENLRGIEVVVQIATNDISGTIDTAGSAEFEFDLHNLSSDQPNRDRYIRSRLFSQNPHLARIIVPDIFSNRTFNAEDAVMRSVNATLQIQDPLGAELAVAQTYDLTLRHDCDKLVLLATTTLPWSDISREPPSGNLYTVRGDIRVQVLLELEPVTP